MKWNEQQITNKYKKYTTKHIWLKFYTKKKIVKKSKIKIVYNNSYIIV